MIINIIIAIFNVVVAIWNVYSTKKYHNNEQAKKIYCDLTSERLLPPKNSGHSTWSRVSLYNPSQAPIFNVFVFSVLDTYRATKESRIY